MKTTSDRTVKSALSRAWRKVSGHSISTQPTPDQATISESQSTSSPPGEYNPLPELPVPAATRSIWDPDDDEWPLPLFHNQQEGSVTGGRNAHRGSANENSVSSMGNDGFGGAARNRSATSRYQNTQTDSEYHAGTDRHSIPDFYRRGASTRYQQTQTSSYISTRRTMEDSQYLEDLPHNEPNIEELINIQYGNPSGEDTHDRLLKPYIIQRFERLPGDLPIRHMHLLNERDYNAHGVLACPRLCDSVATVLYETHLKCLEDFLDPNVSIFEWERHSTFGYSAVIRREGGKVLVGTYKNHGFMLLFKDYVKSSIDFTGRWTEMYAAVSSGTVPCKADGPDWEDFTPSDAHMDPKEPKTMLAFSRRLGMQLVRDRLWDYYPPAGETVTWKADGVISRGGMQRRTDLQRGESSLMVATED